MGAQTEISENCCYKIPLRDKSGRERIIDLCGISEVTAMPCEVDLTIVAQMFGVQGKEIQRPKGRIKLLIGSDYCTLLPRYKTGMYS